MNETKGLWITLIVIVALLALNAIAAILGWSPFTPIVENQIKEKSRAAEVRSKERRDEIRLAEPKQPQFKSQSAGTQQPAQFKEASSVPVGDKSEKLSKPDVLKRPVAPVRPLAPQVPPPPSAPVPPVYIIYYPDGSVRYVTQPVYPAQPPR